MTADRPPIVVIGWGAVAEESLRLQESGMDGEAAWLQAAGLQATRRKPGAGKSKPGPTTLRVAHFLQERGTPLSGQEIAEALGMSRSTTMDVLRRARKYGLAHIAAWRPTRATGGQPEGLWAYGEEP